jgi:hypothetical protein
MAEVLLEFENPVVDEDGKSYLARACGDQMPDGMWQGWVEFLPMSDGEPVRSGRETTQPNREDTVYWATGLTPVFLEGSLHRALNPLTLTGPQARDVLPAIFDSPAPSARLAPLNGDAVLNPFSVYRKGELLLRRQLTALSGWHLVNIITTHELSDRDPALLAAMEPSDLVEMIVNGVRKRTDRQLR